MPSVFKGRDVEDSFYSFLLSVPIYMSSLRSRFATLTQKLISQLEFYSRSLQAHKFRTLTLLCLPIVRSDWYNISFPFTSSSTFCTPGQSRNRSSSVKDTGVYKDTPTRRLYLITFFGKEHSPFIVRHIDLPLAHNLLSLCSHLY
jgi:hypothetical protein